MAEDRGHSCAHIVGAPPDDDDDDDDDDDEFLGRIVCTQCIDLGYCYRRRT